MYQDPIQYNKNLTYFIQSPRIDGAEIIKCVVTNFSAKEMEYSIRSLNLPLTLLDEIKEKIAKLKILLS